MVGRRVHRRGHARITANLTPMIDMAFLLVVFFVVVAQITDRDFVPLDLPRPRAAASSALAEQARTVVNVVPREDDPSVIASVRVGGENFAPDLSGRQALAQRLAQLYRGNPSLRLNVRADRRIQYRFIEPILRAVADGAAQAGVPPRANLVVVREP